MGAAVTGFKLRRETPVCATSHMYNTLYYCEKSTKISNYWIYKVWKFKIGIRHLFIRLSARWITQYFSTFNLQVCWKLHQPLQHLALSTHSLQLSPGFCSANMSNPDPQSLITPIRPRLCTVNTEVVMNFYSTPVLLGHSAENCNINLVLVLNQIKLQKPLFLYRWRMVAVLRHGWAREEPLLSCWTILKFTREMGIDKIVIWQDITKISTDSERFLVGN